MLAAVAGALDPPALAALGQAARPAAPTDAALLPPATASAGCDDETTKVEPGTYAGGVAARSRHDLTIRGVGKRPSPMPYGSSTDSMAIYVIEGARAPVATREFRGVRAYDRNSASLRLEGGSLSVHACSLFDNEKGLLTGKVATPMLSVTESTFVEGSDGQGHADILYVGAIACQAIAGGGFGRMRVDHLFNTRAQRNVVRRYRLRDEEGTSSRKVDLPSGDDALILANLTKQGAASANQTLVSYVAEGYKWPDNCLTLSSNALVNDRTPGGTFVRVRRAVVARRWSMTCSSAVRRWQ